MSSNLERRVSKLEEPHGSGQRIAHVVVLEAGETEDEAFERMGVNRAEQNDRLIVIINNY